MNLNADKSAELQAAVDLVLSQDPSGYYLLCDRLTRAAYVRAVCTIAMRSHCNEMVAAEDAIRLCRRAGLAPREQHVGFYLMDEGRPYLEFVLSGRLSWRGRVNRFVRVNAGWIFASTSIAIFALLTFLLAMVVQKEGLFAMVLWLLLWAVPCIQLSADIARAALHPWFKPKRLSRLIVTEGSVLASQTAVILPVMIASEADIGEAVDTLSRNYANANLGSTRFFLLTDFKDAATAQVSDDAHLLKRIDTEIAALNRRYCQANHEMFHCLYRRRLYNEAENVWMAWERKRGKVVEFCRLLDGHSTTSFFAPKPTVNLRDITYVITLDADSVLEPGAAAALVGVIAHPLNAPCLEGTGVSHGFGLISPRHVAARDKCSGAFFDAMYSSWLPPVSPELQASFDQDFFGRGVFSGKGIFSVEVFRRCIDHRLPENRVLSHDHLEGLFGRVAFASDVLLHEEFPTDALAWRRRQHRWVRGDTQASPWMLPIIPTANDGWARSSLTGLDRWKLLSNLVSHVSPLCLPVIAVAAWFNLFGENGGSTGMWVLVAVFAWSVITPDSALLAPWMSTPIDPSHVRKTGLSRTLVFFKQALARSTLSFILALDFAAVVVDAMLRSFYRVAVSKRHLLQWNTAAAARAATREMSFVQALDEMKRGSMIAVGIAIAIAYLTPANLPWALPVIFIWMLAPCAVFATRPGQTQPRSMTGPPRPATMQSTNSPSGET